MDSSQGEGPDGSSIKSVSSLLARFESANKSTEALNAPHTISRPISPAPKPDKLRDFRPVAEVSSIQPGTPTVPTRPKPKIPASGTHVEPATTEQKPPAPPPPSTRPPVSVKPQVQSLQPPAVNVQPPQSPPKKNAAVVGSVDQSSYLNPDAVATASPANGSKHNFKIPNRPRTPTPALAAPRSPRPNGSQPPSPPPPRRSGEMRREAKPVPVPPPSRLGKPILQPPRAASLSSSPAPNLSSGYKSDISPEVSPFNSPPSSTGTPEDETPPELPNRPRPRSQMVAPSRPKPAAEAFEPPPVHHAVAGHRERNGHNGGSPTKGSLTPQLTGEPRPALPARPRAEESPSRSLVAGAALAMPPKAPRSNKPVHSSASSNAQAELPPKRVSSTPSTQAVSQPSTRMQHGRSKTFDQRSSEPLGETATRSQVVIASKSSTNSTIPAGVTSTAKSEASGNITVYPDGMNSNRRPPFVKKGCYEIATKYDPRIFDICGELVCTSGQLTRVWSSLEGDLLMSLAHTEGVKATSISFKPGATPRDDGKFIWIGMNSGDLMEVELTTQRLTVSKPHVHGRFEVTNIFRHFNELWTLDESGSLLVWGPGEDGVPNISSMPTQSFRVPRQHSFAMVVGDELWHATGKEMRVFLPTLDGRSQFQVLVRPLTADGAGDITSGTTIKSHPNKVFLGHSDGKISIYSTTDYTLLGIISVSTWKINALAGVGNNLWAAYNLGKICVYDVDQNPWVILKEWQAHDHPVVKMKADVFSAYHMDRSQVLSLGADNKIKVWDGLLQDDWLEEELKARDTQYCDFEEIRALVLTWNAGATTPHSLRYSENDSNFFQNLIQTSDAPEILIFGFQELVDLEDKRATAKRFFKTSKKKEGPDQEHMSHQYRDWRDFLMKSLDDYMPADNLYYLLHTAPLVGLFTCVFVKASLRERISNLNAAEIKRGMGGLHGNKGAVAVRFQIDDSSLCFVNCHLAAGQTQANARHNDIAAILETNVFPSARDPEARLDSYCGGGDGTLIIDHELCILNGDLNYRIDTMSRDTVVMAVKQKNLAKLLERDQLLVARRRNPAFRLRAFEELPITFAPTYKYDVGTDTYDTSEKRRSPAWCDRLLFRGRGRMQQMDYLRHEVRVSDHRPVSGSFHMWVKKVDPRGRAETWMQCQQEFEDIRQRETGDEKLRYLMNVCGYDEATSRAHLKDLAKVRRSPSRAREAPPERH